MANEDKRLNTVGTLLNKSQAELLRTKIGDANGEDYETNFHEGLGSNEDFNGFPKEFYTENLDFKGKIDLILKKKEITIQELALEIKIQKEDLKRYYEKNIIPNDEVLSLLSSYSGYPIAFFKMKSMIEKTKNNHKRNLIIGFSILFIVLFIIVFGIVYISLFL